MATTQSKRAERVNGTHFKRERSLRGILAANVTALRQRIGLTQEQLAAKTGLSLARVAALERDGSADLDLRELTQVANALDVDPARLLVAPTHARA